MTHFIRCSFVALVPMHGDVAPLAHCSDTPCKARARRLTVLDIFYVAITE